MQKRIIFLFVILTLMILLVPTLLVTTFSESTDSVAQVEAKEAVQKKKTTIIPSDEKMPPVRVYLTKEKRVLEVPLEEYITGVVASEMPADFHEEALKAQALAARTYIVKRLTKKEFTDLARWGTIAKTAHVTDTVQHQVFSTEQQLRSRWGIQYDEKQKRIESAVQATKGNIIVYQGEPIYAAFFSTSNGRTENSEDYFLTNYPYLRSVDSSWDQQSPKYDKEQVLTMHQFTQLLAKETGKSIAIPTAASPGQWMRVIEKTAGNRILKIRIGDEIFSGREVREALHLASSDFSWQVKGNEMIFTTRGYGHGVGMSQWGAHLMAKQGKEVLDIIQHYYQGVKVKPISAVQGDKK
ncbi:stage II sporulation protein D [Hazenella coriacea]|uniref:Stage II sporulation protein D n=1 Tax=Hazenella coriacea TaxID=1179467 RepID=A0A4R3L7U4_9BACL|nr:stage II sporulation protein D [Hazenella coriacea]TCS95612.1 stage II sporulation protein D [Hazenella coriacea]